ncbi:MAG: hypothetical protein Q8O03_07485 [Nanoarchaeota archaeon]|nr:hypothetical protein [Nanoarchaeota archaeon]
MELLKALVIKISEAYDKLFRTWTRFVIFFAAYFIATSLLPKGISTIIMFAFLAFILTGIFGRGLRKKGPKN